MNPNATVSSTDPVLDGRHLEACLNATLNLLGEVSTFTRMYAERFGRRPPLIVMLASTDVCAAVNIASRVREEPYYVWGYDRNDGRLYVGGSGISVFLCEYPALNPWDCEITAPGDITLGRALMHRATIATTR